MLRAREAVMQHVVRTPSAPFLSMQGALQVHLVPAGVDNLVWVLECTQTGEAAVVDGPDAAGALALCEARGLRLTTVLNTHTHGDHIGVNQDLAARGLLAGMRVIGAKSPAEPIPGLTEAVWEGDRVRFGALEGEVMVTEGHQNGHISFLFGDVLCCGDTLFGGGCGFLFDGPPEKMYASLMRLAKLPGGTRVCCAHEYTQDNLLYAWTLEPDNDALAERIRRVWDTRERGACSLPSKIEEELATNPFLRPGSPTIQYVLGRALPDADLSTPEAIFAATRRLKDTKRYRALPEDRLPL